MFLFGILRDGACVFFCNFQCEISVPPIWLNLNCLMKQTILNLKLNYHGQKCGKMEAYCVYIGQGLGASTCVAARNMDGYY